MASPPTYNREARHDHRAADVRNHPAVGALAEKRVRERVCRLASEIVNRHLDGAICALRHLDAAVADLEVRCGALERAAGLDPARASRRSAASGVETLAEAILAAYADADGDIIFLAHAGDAASCTCAGPIPCALTLFGSSAYETLCRQPAAMLVALEERGLDLNRHQCGGTVLYTVSCL